MKEPKSFKHPRLYWRPNPYTDLAEAIIIYPNGIRPERTWLNFTHQGLFQDHSPSEICWYREGMSPAGQVRAMKNISKIYDCEIVFLGELK